VDSGSEVVLLDGDVRRPQLRTMLGLPPRKIPKGFEGGGERSAQRADEVPAVPGLLVLEQRELLGAEPSARSREQRAAPLRAVLRTADYVIVDTPPLGHSSDALMLLREVDDVLLVVRPGRTRRTELETAWDVIRRAGVNPLGIVVTGSTVRTRPLPEE
jgi:Mrp family chromosome partitioning ATPase